MITSLSNHTTQLPYTPSDHTTRQRGEQWLGSLYGWWLGKCEGQHNHWTKKGNPEASDPAQKNSLGEATARQQHGDAPQLDKVLAFV